MSDGVTDSEGGGRFIKVGVDIFSCFKSVRLSKDVCCARLNRSNAVVPSKTGVVLLGPCRWMRLVTNKGMNNCAMSVINK